MKKISLLIILGLLTFVKLEGQTRYYKYISAAKLQFEEGLYEDSALLYEQAFNEKEGTKWTYYDAGCAWAKSKRDNIKALEYLKESIKRGMYDLEKLDTDENINSLRKESEWKDLRKKLIRSRKEFEEGLNKPLKKELEEINRRDQTLRKLYQVAVKELGQDTLGIRYYEKLIKREDSICQSRVIELIEKYGWLGISDVGEEGNRTIWLVIQHSPLEIQEKYYPKMKDSVDKGESNGGDFAYLLDRILMRKGEKQIYGSQYTYDRETRKRYFYPIKDYKTVNARREEVGLIPIEEYAKLINLEYDPFIWK